MTAKGFVDYIHLMTRTNATTFTVTDIIKLANVRLETLSRALMGTDEDVLVVPLRTNLIGPNLTYPNGLREYPFPTHILSRIKYVEAKLDGTNWIHLTEFDLNQYQRTTDETYILQRFNNQQGHAFYDIDRKALWLYCGLITNVELGLKLWCNVYPSPLDVTRMDDDINGLEVDPSTIALGFPRELHELWARGVIIDYKESREKPIPLSSQENVYKQDLTQAIWDLKNGNMDRSFTAKTPPASDRGNDGANY